MMTLRNVLAAASTIALISSCSAGETDTPAAAASNQAAPAAENMAGMASDPNNPFAQAEMQMHERMMAAIGANASETWVKKMIEHHRGAVEMSNALIGLGGDAPVVAAARKIVSDQGREIADLERMLQAGGIGTGTSENRDPYKQSDQTMHDRMMAATGASPHETWLRKMIEHHRGAVDMSNILIAQGGDPKVVERARTTVATQQKELEQFEQMLGGDEVAGSPPAPGAPGSATAPTPKVTPRAPKTPAPASKAEEPKPAAKAAPRAAPEAAPKPVAKSAPEAAAAKPACLPEHRAMGHC